MDDKARLLELLQKKKTEKDFIPPTEVVIKGVQELKGDKGDSPTQEELLELIRPLIPPPIKGDKGDSIKGDSYILTEKDKREISKLIKVPVLEKVVERIETIVEKPIVTNLVKEVAVGDSADDIRNKLELLKGSDRLDLKAINGIDKFRNDLLEVMNQGLMSLDTFHGLGIKLNGVKIDNANELNFIMDGAIAANSDQGVDITIPTGGGGGSPGGPDTAIQFNDAGSFGGNSNFIYEKVSGTFVVADETGADTSIIVLPGALYAFGDFNDVYDGGLLSFDGAQGHYGYTNTNVDIDDGRYLVTMGGTHATVPNVVANSPFPSGSNPGFTGSGLNDMMWTGYLADVTSVPSAFHVEILGANNYGFTYSGPSLTIGNTITQTTGAGAGTTGELYADLGGPLEIINVVPVGPGFENGETIDDGLVSGTIVSPPLLLSDLYQGDITDFYGTSSFGPIYIDGSQVPQTVISNVGLYFSSPTGHVVGDTWDWSYTDTVGQMFNFDGDGYNWAYGDIDNLIKGQTVRLHYGSDPTDWIFDVGDNRGSFLHLNPIDAPTKGKYWIGDYQHTNGGTALFINDDYVDAGPATIGLYTTYDSNQMALVQANSIGQAFMGDPGGVVNQTYIAIDDTTKQVQARADTASVSPNSAYLDIGQINIPNLSFLGTGSFLSVSDDSTGQQGVNGVGDFGVGFGPTASFVLNTNTHGDVAVQVVDIDPVSGPGFFQLASILSGDSFHVTMDAHSWIAEGNVNNTSISINDTTQLITFNGQYSFPYTDGTNHQVLETNGAGTLSWVTPSAGAGPGGSIYDVQFNNGAGGFAGAGAMSGLKAVLNDLTRVATVEDTSGTYLELDINNGFYSMGDLSNTANHSYIIVDDSTGEFNFQSDVAATGGTYLFLNPSTQLYQIGDILGTGNKSFLEINDATTGLMRYMSDAVVTNGLYWYLDPLGATYSFGDLNNGGNGMNFTMLDGIQKATIGDMSGSYLSLDGANDLFGIGQLSATGNQNRLTIDDANQVTTMTIGASNKLYFSFEPNNGVYQYGDLQGYKNSSQFIMGDGTINASNRYLQYQTLGKIFMKLDPGQKLYRIGDIGAENNSTTVEINDATANKSVFLNGSVVYKYVAKTTTYTIATNDHTIDCTSGTFTVTLPTAVGVTGKVYIVKNSGAGIITVDTTSAQTIDGLSSQSLSSLAYLIVQSNGANWIVIG